LGDTDLATVRLVQNARIPPANQYVKDVPPVLDQILGHALARDPKARYQTAREFGRDLNAALFQLGRPVSSFDIGSLIADVREEQRRQRGARPKQQTLIGNLIQDAMMSFTSLQDGEERDPSFDAGPDEQSGVGAIPLSFGTFEGSQTGARLPPAEPSQASFATPPSGFQAGNLAALEDQALDAPLDLSQPPRSSPQASPRSLDPAVLKPGRLGSRALPPLATFPGTAARPAAAPHARLPVRFWLVAATMIAAGAAAAAYFAGIFS
jgi:hypothetical protein